MFLRGFGATQGSPERRSNGSVFSFTLGSLHSTIRSTICADLPDLHGLKAFPLVCMSLKNLKRQVVTAEVKIPRGRIVANMDSCRYYANNLRSSTSASAITGSQRITASNECLAHLNRCGPLDVGYAEVGPPHQDKKIDGDLIYSNWRIVVGGVLSTFVERGLAAAKTVLSFREPPSFVHTVSALTETAKLFSNRAQTRAAGPGNIRIRRKGTSSPENAKG